MKWPERLAWTGIAAGCLVLSFCIGRNSVYIPPPATFGEKLTALHSYMREDVTRWAWKQAYCGKKRHYEDETEQK